MQRSLVYNYTGLKSKIMNKDIIKEILQDSITLREQILSDAIIINNITKLAELALSTLKKNNKIILAGNGGSFADAQHISAEFIGRFVQDRAPLAAICLGTNLSSVTSISNDYNFNDIFARELSVIGQSGDLFIAISTSGNSQNIINAVQVAQQNNINIFCLLGNDGGKLAKYDNITIPSNSTARIQEMHITIGHMICAIVDNAITL